MNRREKYRDMKRMYKSILSKYALKDVEVRIFSFKQNKKWIKQFSNHESLLSCAAFYTSYYKMICIDADVVRDRSLDYFKRLFLHEVAHALLPDDNTHSKQWKMLCSRIGGFTNSLIQARAYIKQTTIVG